MGTRIFRDTTLNNPANPSVRRLGGAFDFPLLLIMIFFLVFGLMMVFSASWDFSLQAYDDAMHIFFTMGGAVDRANEAVSEVAAKLRQAFSRGSEGPQPD